MKNKIPFVLSVSIPVVLAGCMVGPDYNKPEVKVGAAYSQTGSLSTAAAEPPVRWWEALHDATLTALIDDALRQNLDLQAAEARVREARAERNAAAGAYQPSLNANGQASRDSFSRNGEQFSHLPPGIPNTQNDFKAGFDASWELDFFGHNRRSVQAADAQVGVTQENRNAVALTVAGEVARQYIDYRAYQQRTDLLRQAIALQENTLRLVRLQAKAGVATDLDVARAETEWRTQRAQLPALDAGMQAAVQSLAVLTGRSADALTGQLRADAPVPQVTETVPVGLPSGLLLRRPDIRAAERRLAAATAQVGVAVSNQFPRFSLVGGLGLESVLTGDFADAASRYWSIGPRVSVPLLNGGSLKSQVQAREEARDAALLSYRQTVLSALADVETALIRFGHQRETAAELMAARATAQHAVDLAKQRYQVGETPLTDVLDAERKLNQLNDQLAQLDGDLALSFVSLNKALGGGWQATDERSKS